MNNSDIQNLSADVRADFGAKANPPAETPQKTSPVCVRFTAEERELLLRSAGSRSVSAYVREATLGAANTTKRRAKAPPKIDHEVLGRLLGALGQSRLAQNMNQLAKMANMGALPLTPDVVMDLRDACADISAMREALLSGLGFKDTA